MPHHMLYHYTDRLSAADILRDGTIRAMPITLHRDMFAQDAGIVTPPIIWLTINPVLDMTVVVKMIGAGWPKALIGDLCRVVVRDDFPAQAFCDFVDAMDTAGIEPAWWDWTVRTGKMAGSDYTTWYVCQVDIAREDWVAVEVLDGIESGGATKWKVIG